MDQLKEDIRRLINTLNGLAPLGDAEVDLANALMQYLNEHH